MEKNHRAADPNACFGKSHGGAGGRGSTGEVEQRAGNAHSHRQRSEDSRCHRDDAHHLGHLSALTEAVSQPTLSDVTIERLKTIIEGLRAVPVNVEIKVQPVEKEVAGEPPVEVTSTTRQD